MDPREECPFHTHERLRCWRSSARQHGRPLRFSPEPIRVRQALIAFPEMRHRPIEISGSELPLDQRLKALLRQVIAHEAFALLKAGESSCAFNAIRARWTRILAALTPICKICAISS